MHGLLAVANDPTTNGIVTTFVFASLVALAKKATDFIKHATSLDVSGTVTLVIAWIMGWVVVAVAAAQTWLDRIAVGGVPLFKMNGASQAVIGFAFASLAALVHDLLPKTKPIPPILGGRLSDGRRP